MGKIMTQQSSKFLLPMEELIESESFALKVLNASLNGLYIHDVKIGQNVFINKQYTTLTGYTFKDLQAMDEAQFFTLFHPDDRQRVAEHIRRLVLDKDDLLEIEYRFKTKDGRWIWCLSRDGVFARDADGSVCQFMGTFLDITERKRTEEALRKAADELEIKARERTAELQQAIRRLQEENQESIRTEQSLRLEEARLDALLYLSRLSEASLQEISNFTLEQAIRLTDSKIGFLGMLNEDESVYTLHAVSKDIVKECNITGDPLQWHVVNAGIWADAIRERKTLFVNDYSKPHPGKKGLPAGHPYVERFMVVPILEKGKTVAVAGVGNKASEYDTSDERQVALLLNGMCGYVQKNRSREELREAYNELEEKVRQRTAQLADSTVRLQENQRDLKRAQEVGQIGSWRLDVRRNVLSWSDQNYRIFGVPGGTALTYETFLEIVHPDDRRYVDARWNASLRGEPYDIEHRIVVNGEVKWVREKAYLELDDAGTLLGGFGITQDITERKVAEKKLRRAKATSEALNRVSEVLHATLDFDEIMQWIVVEGSAFLGSESAAVSLREDDHWIVSHVHDLPSGLVGARMEDNQEKHAALALKSRQPVAVEDAFNDDRFNREHMRRHNIRSVLVAPLIIRGEAVGVIFFNYHSARHSFTSAEVNFSRQMASVAGVALTNARLFEALHESNQELNEYAYALTHNLKAPLRAIHNYVNFLFEDLSDTLEEEPKTYLEGIKDAIIQSNKQFEDLETLYRTKNHPLNFEPFEMRELLAELQFIFKDTSEEKLIIAENWPALRGERFLLRQILFDLISNGFKFNRADIKRVEVGWQAAAGNGIEIFVRDNGIGIDPQFHEHILEIFKRLHTDREYEGTGIGLAIVKRAVQNFGGKLRLESAVGEGSTFYVSLPNSILKNNPIE
jgi:PAS domain S-box-containing protein